MTNDKLAEYRIKIDEIDKQIVALLGKRMEVVRQVGDYKKAHNLPALDQARWNAVLDTKIALAKIAGLDPEMIKDIYNRIHKAALTIEERSGERRRGEEE